MSAETRAATRRPGSTRDPDDGVLERGRRRNLVLTIFGTYVLPTPGPVWAGGLVQALEDLGFTTAAARITLSRMVNRGFLSRSKNGRRVYFEMSPSLIRVLSEGERRIFGFGLPEATALTWTLLSYSIPEGFRAERDRLRKRLTFLGFASIHDGFWFAPHDRVDYVVEILEELELGQYAEIFTGAPADGTDISSLIARAWETGDLEATYVKFIEEYKPYRSQAMRQRLSDRESFLVRTRVVHEFRQFGERDPELPGNLPYHVHRRQAIETFYEVYGGLAELAQAYFDRLAAPGLAARG